MNNTTNIAIGAGLLAFLGRWSQGKPLDVRIVVGVVFVAAFLSAMPEKVARPFAWLILAVALFTYGPELIGRTGVTRTRREQAAYEAGKAGARGLSQMPQRFQNKYGKR